MQSKVQCLKPFKAINSILFIHPLTYISRKTYWLNTKYRKNCFSKDYLQLDLKSLIPVFHHPPTEDPILLPQ